jgi:hypothetical protein
MSLEKKLHLMGKPFIGTTVSYDSPKITVERVCCGCFYRDVEETTTKDCQMQGHLAKAYFGIKPEDRLPMRINGREVGNYCPHFLIYDAE